MKYELLVYYNDGFKFKLIPSVPKKIKCGMIIR